MLSHMVIKDEMELVEYDSVWESLFLREAEIIHGVLKDLVPVVAHIGSTAVPGMCARPTIDLLIGVKDLKDERIITSFKSIGYV